MKSVLAYGVIRNGGPQIRWQRSEPDTFVVEKENFDNMSTSIEVVDGKWYAMIREVHLCDDYDDAVRALDEMVAVRTKNFDDSAFDGGPVDASEWPF